MMKARVFRIFKDDLYKIGYTYVSPAKCHDDVQSVWNGEMPTPMMEIRMHREDDGLEDETLCVWTSPEVVKKYTGFNIFNQDYRYSFEGRVLDIEFEWIEGVYPYGKLYDSAESLVVNVAHSPIDWFERNNPNNRYPSRRDYVVSTKERYPRIDKIEEFSLMDWL